MDILKGQGFETPTFVWMIKHAFGINSILFWYSIKLLKHLLVLNYSIVITAYC